MIYVIGSLCFIFGLLIAVSFFLLRRCSSLTDNNSSDIERRKNRREITAHMMAITMVVGFFAVSLFSMSSFVDHSDEQTTIFATQVMTFTSNLILVFALFYWPKDRNNNLLEVPKENKDDEEKK